MSIESRIKKCSTISEEDRGTEVRAAEGHGSAEVERTAEGPGTEAARMAVVRGSEGARTEEGDAAEVRGSGVVQTEVAGVVEVLGRTGPEAEAQRQREGAGTEEASVEEIHTEIRGDGGGGGVEVACCCFWT